MGCCYGKAKRVDVLKLPEFGGNDAVHGSQLSAGVKGASLGEERKQNWEDAIHTQHSSRTRNSVGRENSRSSVQSGGSANSWRLLGIPDAPPGLPIAVPRRSREMLAEATPTLLRVQLPSGLSDRSVNSSHSNHQGSQGGSKRSTPGEDPSTSPDAFRPPLTFMPFHSGSPVAAAAFTPGLSMQQTTGNAARVASSDAAARSGAQEGTIPSDDGLRFADSLGSKDDGYFTGVEKKLRERPIRRTESSRQTRKLRYKKGELLGMGAVGKVYLALDMDTGKLIAVKEIALKKSGGGAVEKQLEKLEREINMMRGLRHPHVVKYKGVSKHDKTLAIFMEYVPGGSLASLAREFNGFSERVLVKYAKQVLEGLHYLHCHRIVHCDVKGGNILVSRDGVCKLTDFGASREVAELAKSSKNGIYRLAGTPFWMAPEVIRQKPYGRKADIWSFGCTVIEMATGTHAWPQFDDPMVAIYHISSGTAAPAYPAHLSPLATDFLTKCLAADPTERPTAAQLLLHPFLTTDGSMPHPRRSPSPLAHDKPQRNDIRRIATESGRQRSAPEAGHVTAMSLTVSVDGSDEFVPELWRRSNGKRRVIKEVVLEDDNEQAKP